MCNSFHLRKVIMTLQGFHVHLFEWYVSFQKQEDIYQTKHAQVTLRRCACLGAVSYRCSLSSVSPRDSKEEKEGDT